MSEPAPTLLYCHCRYAKVVPEQVKESVLKALCESGLPFEAVPDLCELSARSDPSLKRLATGPVKISACYPRAVKWLFSAANAPLPQDSCEVVNMRTLTAEDAAEKLLSPNLEPNLPAKTEPPQATDQTTESHVS
ncbi:MAG: hypothetical protein RI897_2295 [Verrucomicrobiota bacterium]|jgi:hypothetical protein